MKHKIGVVGYGDFTKVICQFLAPQADILVSSRTAKSGEAGFGAQFAPLEQVLAQPIIIPSIPSQFFETFFETNRQLVNSNALVVDVCSVKVKPLEVLERLLPNTCQIIGTHPMFGPASIAKNSGLKDLKCVVCPQRVDPETLEKFIKLLSDQLGLQVIRRTPDEHDRDMAFVQGLSHYIGRTMDGMSIPHTELSTLAYDDLLDMKNIQGQDSWDLFTSIMHENPYTKEVNDRFKQACRELDERIGLV